VCGTQIESNKLLRNNLNCQKPEKFRAENQVLFLAIVFMLDSRFIRRRGKEKIAFLDKLGNILGLFEMQSSSTACLGQLFGSLFQDTLAVQLCAIPFYAD